jgi:hypothetical protein
MTLSSIFASIISGGWLARTAFPTLAAKATHVSLLKGRDVGNSYKALCRARAGLQFRFDHLLKGVQAICQNHP